MTAPGADPSGCPFCAIITSPAGRADGFVDYGDVVSFLPLNPVAPGHRLFVPVEHVKHAGESPAAAGRAVAVAARWIAGWPGANLITSAGAAATQTVEHLHVHLVPRHAGDGLTLPWTGQEARRG